MCEKTADGRKSQLHVFEAGTAGIDRVCGELGGEPREAHGADNGDDAAGVHGRQDLLYV